MKLFSFIFLLFHCAYPISQDQHGGGIGWRIFGFLNDDSKAVEQDESKLQIQFFALSKNDGEPDCQFPTAKENLLPNFSKEYSCVIPPPYRRLAARQIKMRDSLLELTVEAFPSKNNGSLLHLEYYFSFNHRALDDSPELQAAWKQRLAFESFDLKVNKLPYTGRLKLAIPFHNAGISTSYSGFDLYIMEYANGKLITLKKLKDVDPITEQYMVRPT